MQLLPNHLKKYIVDQNYQRYTAQDHAVWRYTVRQLKAFLSVHAHECYLDGIEKTGITENEIPKIEDISAKLEKFGWRALPVSGFIPPAAFMELQSLGLLPIASDMRSIDHLLYTPAPDIVHEAAGHAPILINKEYADYLKQYAQVAKMAILSQEDLALYDAIRILSDLKENPSSTEPQIKAAENRLAELSKSISYTSEGSQLSRMNWWTAEYGLIGQMNSPKIFGAGLLSSVGESKWCLSDKVKKIPLTVDCIKQGYDITEPQPQLFVAESFAHLAKVLTEFSETMAYKQGGISGIKKAIQAKTVNTVQFENGLQVSGIVSDYICDQQNNLIFVKLNGPSQISVNNTELAGHGTTYHKDGYSTPIGEIINFSSIDLTSGRSVTLNYKSGIKISGEVVSKLGPVLTLKNATCLFKEKALFLPEWGNYDIILANTVTSVFGGPADRANYGEIVDFTASRVPTAYHNKEQIEIFELYEKLIQLRKVNTLTPSESENLFNLFKQKASNHWLLFLDLFELSQQREIKNVELNEYLKQILTKEDESSNLVREGLSLIDAKL